MTEGMQYCADHLTTAEIKEVAAAVYEHYMLVVCGQADVDDILYADPEELHDEYMFWISEYEKRIGYGDTASEDY